MLHENKGIELDVPSEGLITNYGSTQTNIPLKNSRRKFYGYVMLAAVLFVSGILIGVAISPTESTQNEKKHEDDVPIGPNLTMETLKPEMKQCSSGSYSITSSSKKRSFNIYVPSGITSSSSIIFVWHGIAASPDKIRDKVKMDKYATEHRWVVVYPQGDGFLSAFNGMGCCDSSPKDVQFAADIIDWLNNLGCGTANKVYTTGFSNGGFMSHLLGCEVGKSKYKAIAVHSGLIGDYSGNLPTWSSFQKCSPSQVPPIYAIHGTADTTVSYNGGKSNVPFSNARWYSFQDSMNIWRKNSNCDSSKDYIVTPKTRTTCTYNSGCGVRKCVVDGLAHDWSGNDNSRDDPSATEMIVNFFEDYGA